MNKRILKNDLLQIEYLTDVLRISGLVPAGKMNLFADLGELPSIPTPYGDFYFRGGHRLWHSPEAMPRTYIPDTPVTLTELPDGVLLEAQTEAGTGIRKRIEIHLDPDKPSLKLTHTLINDGMWPVELAAWALTQCRLGGTVIMPMPVGNVDEAGLLPNRQFSLWPYVRINDPRLKLGDEFIVFKAQALLPPFKIGYFNTAGWLAYEVDGILVRKTFSVTADRVHPDNNCNAEVYCNDQFVELESLGPLKILNPQASITHVETWDVFDQSEIFPQEIRKALAMGQADGNSA